MIEIETHTSQTAESVLHVVSVAHTITITHLAPLLHINAHPLEMECAAVGKQLLVHSRFQVIKVISTCLIYDFLCHLPRFSLLCGLPRRTSGFVKHQSLYASFLLIALT